MSVPRTTTASRPALRLVGARLEPSVQGESEREPVDTRDFDQVFRRYRLDGMGQAAIARDLGVSLSSVEKDLQKAYRALAELKMQFDAE